MDGSAILFDGAHDYLHIPDNDAFYFGSGDFTLEFRAMWKAVGPALFFQQSDSTGGYILKWYFYFDGSRLVLAGLPERPAARP